MKSSLKSSAIAAFAAVVMFSAAGVARASDMITVRVPFPFMVSHTELPAGSYVLTADSLDPNVMKIASEDGRQLAYVVTQTAADNPAAATTPQLQFKKMDGEYFLSAINADDGRQLAVSGVPSRIDVSSRATATR